mgnify:CR=1 FL=1
MFSMTPSPSMTFPFCFHSVPCWEKHTSERERLILLSFFVFFFPFLFRLTFVRVRIQSFWELTLGAVLPQRQCCSNSGQSGSRQTVGADENYHAPIRVELAAQRADDTLDAASARSQDTPTHVRVSSFFPSLHPSLTFLSCASFFFFFFSCFQIQSLRTAPIRSKLGSAHLRAGSEPNHRQALRDTARPGSGGHVQ